MRMLKKPSYTFAAVAFSVLCLSGAATAESPESQQTPAVQKHQEEVKAEVDEKQIDQFVVAYVKVQEINEDYSQQLQAEKEPAKTTELQQEAQVKMEKAVTESGLTIPEYKQIASLAGHDAELRARIQAELAN